MSELHQLDEDASVWPAVVQFSLFYLGLTVAAAAVSMAFEFGHSTGLSIGILVASVYPAAQKFVKLHHRPFKRNEQVRFAALAFVATLVVSFVLFAFVALVLIEGEDLPTMADLTVLAKENAALIVFSMAVVFLIDLAVLYFSAGWFSRFLARRLETVKT